MGGSLFSSTGIAGLLGGLTSGGGGGLGSLLGGLGLGGLGGIFGGAGGAGGGGGSVGFLGASADIGGIAQSISSVARGAKDTSAKQLDALLVQERYKLGIRPSLTNDLAIKVKRLLASGQVGFSSVGAVLGFLPGPLQDEGSEALVRGTLGLKAPQFNIALQTQSAMPVIPPSIGRIGSASWKQAQLLSQYRYNPLAFLGGYS